MEALKIDATRTTPNFENVQWFIRSGYKKVSESTEALDALNLAYILQTKLIKAKHRSKSGTFGDTDADLQNSLKY